MGRNCKRGQVGDAVVMDAPGNRPPESDNASALSSIQTTAPLSAEVGDKILNQLSSISDKFTTLEDRVRRAEVAIANRTNEPVALPTTVSDTQISNVAASTLNTGSDIVPTPDF